MSRHSSGSLPRDVAVSDHSDSSNDSFLVQTIRQLPLPAVPSVLQRVSDAPAKVSPAPREIATAAAATATTAAPANLSSSLRVLPGNTETLPPVPPLPMWGVPLNVPAATINPAADVPRPSVPLPSPLVTVPVPTSTASTSSSSTLSPSAAVPVPLSTAAAAAAAGGAAAIPLPSVPALVAAAPTVTGGLTIPFVPVPAAMHGSRIALPPPPPPLLVPTPAPTAPVPATLGEAAVYAPLSSGDCAVTSLRRPTPKAVAVQASAPVVVPTSPSVIAAVPSAAAAAAPLAPSSSLAVSTTPPAAAAGDTFPAVVPSAAATPPQERPRHLRRARDILESADCALFTSADREGSSSSSSSISKAGDSTLYVGRTRRVGGAAALKRERRSCRGGADGDDNHDGAAHRHRGRSSHPQGGKGGHTKRKHHYQQVVRMHEVEGKPASVETREKTSASSQSSNALTSDKVALMKREARTTTFTAAAASLPVEEGVVVSNQVLTEDACRGSASDVPLTFTSPAARLADLYKTSDKEKGLSRRSGGGGGSSDDGTALADVMVEGEDEDEATSDRARAGMLHFRITGAFSDVGGDSKTLLSRIAGENKPFPTQRGSRDGQTGAAAAAANQETTVLAVTVRGMSPLHADPGVVHPFVRIWIVSCVTGQSLVHASAAVPCAVTQPFDLRGRMTRAPWWEAKVALRVSTERLRGASSDAMLLLEVLDFGSETIHGFPLMRTSLYPICWGFLMLRDCTGRATLNIAENQHVQLFRYPQRKPWYLTWLETLLPFPWSAAGAYLQPADLESIFGVRRGSGSASAGLDVPSIYYVFRSSMNRKIPYQGAMVLSLQQQRNAGYVPGTTEMLPYEEYLLSMLVSGGGSCVVPRSTQAAARAEEEEDDAYMADEEARGMRGRLASSVPASPWTPAVTENYYRMDGERSLLPHELLGTTAVLGVVTCVAFAHNGTLFAVGLYRDLQYLVELRDPLLPDMPVVATLLGHTAHVHRVAFQKEDRYLLSCSSDGTVRVWQPAYPNSPFTADKCVGRSSVQCVCTLPHGFPVYAAIFHQEKIIAGGFSDQLFVWGYDRPLERGELPSMATAEAEDSSLHLTATFTPELQTTPNDEGACDNGALARPARVLLGELVHRVDNAGSLAEGGEPTITISLASNERSNRVWSAHANGAVVCWRAVSESFKRGSGGRATHMSSGGHSWQMSVRHRADCDGASEVQVSGNHAIVICAGAPLVFVFDATTCEQLRVVSTRLPPTTPLSLLPDGEAFVGAVGDPSRLVAWECFDGGLCTPVTGYAEASPLFGVSRMAWAESQQLAVLVSRSPCTEEDMVRYARGPAAPAPGQSAAAFYYAQQEQQYRLEGIPAEMTLLTVAGTVRRRATVIQTGEGRASGAFCALFGGDMSAKRKAAYLAQRTQASRRQETERSSRRARLHEEALMSNPSSAFAAATTTVPYDATEKGARMNAIINFWRGLVGQHKHGAEDVQRAASGTASAAAGPSTPTRAFTQRALQYLDADGKEAEV